MKKFIITALKVIIFFVGWAVCASIVDIPSDNPAIWRFGAELTPLLWTILFTVVFYFVDKRKTTIPVKKSIGKSLLWGLVIGIIWIGVCTGLLLGIGAEKITGSNHIEFLWLWIISAFLNTIMQELLVRGYIYQLIKREYSVMPATIVTTALFTLAHGGALEAGIIPVLNIITMSLFVTALYEYTGNLIAPIMTHAVWNIVGSIILGGVSLADDYPKMMNMIPSGNSIVSGGEYMIEASIVVLFANIILAVLFMVLTAKKYKKSSEK